jgi:hypothetical protein
MTFLFIWDKGSYRGVAIYMLFPCIYVLYPQLVYLL